MQPPIANILHQDTIRRLASDGAFERGKAYFDEGRVTEMRRQDGSVHAQVRGTRDPYAVRIWMKDDSLAYACSCPQGQEQAFCKHAVAVALALLGGSPREAPKEAPGEESPRPVPVRPKVLDGAAHPPSPTASIVTTDAAASSSKTSLADSLRAMSHEALVVVVLEAALDDDGFRERLAQRLRRR